MISVVDDDEPVRKALCRIVGSAGFAARPFATGRQFLDSLRLQLPDCAVLDLHLPGFSGLEIQRQLSLRAPAVPSILITGRDEPGLDERARAAGAGAFLRKPIDKRVLLETLTRVMGIGQSLKQPEQGPACRLEQPLGTYQRNYGGQNEAGG